MLEIVQASARVNRVCLPIERLRILRARHDAVGLQEAPNACPEPAARRCRRIGAVEARAVVVELVRLRRMAGLRAVAPLAACPPQEG